MIYQKSPFSIGVRTIKFKMKKKKKEKEKWNGYAHCLLVYK